MLVDALAVTTLVVTDVDRSKKFYAEQLGLTLLDENSEWSQLLAVASREALAGGLHPLSAAFDRANEVLRIAG